MTQLSARKREILRHVVEEYVATGQPVGSRYRIRFGRWPGGNLVFDRLQQPDQISRMLAQDSFDGFYKALDVVSEVVPSALPAAKLGLQTLARKVPGNSDVQTITRAPMPRARIATPRRPAP